MFFILSPIFIGCGVYLITYTIQRTAYAGTSSQYYYYVAPYQDAGIVLTVFGGIFFFSAIGLIIAGAVNLALGIKAKRNSSHNEQENKLMFVSRYNMNTESNELSLNYKF